MIAPIALLGAGALALAAREAWMRSRELDLRDRTVLVAGASRGLGFLLAREFGLEGARVAICARDEVTLARAVSELRDRGVEVWAMPCDVSDRAAVDTWIQGARERFGDVDVLVNNAGILEVGPVEAMGIADFERALGTILWGPLYTTLAVLPEMRRRGEGRIVNVASIGGKIATPHLLPYVTAKFALVGLSEGLRAEVAADGVKVTTVVPGFMRTGSDLGAAVRADDPKREFAWFALGESPGLSIDAEGAAKRIVRATKRGEAELILSLPANIAARLWPLAPGVAADLMSLFERVVMSTGERPVDATGRSADASIAAGPYAALRAWQRRAAETLQHLGAPTR